MRKILLFCLCVLSSLLFTVCKSHSNPEFFTHEKLDQVKKYFGTIIFADGALHENEVLLGSMNIAKKSDKLKQLYLYNEMQKQNQDQSKQQNDKQPCKSGNLDCDGNASNGCETNIVSDVKNCGACGAACSSDQACNNGKCIAQAHDDAKPCASGFGNCDANNSNGCETNVRVDLNHCGACGKVCSARNGVSQCSNGQCVISYCNAGYANCDLDSSNGCETNVRTDLNHCGKCGNKCTGGSSCVNGACYKQ